MQAPGEVNQAKVFAQKVYTVLGYISMRLTMDFFAVSFHVRTPLSCAAAAAGGSGVVSRSRVLVTQVFTAAYGLSVWAHNHYYMHWVVGIAFLALLFVPAPRKPQSQDKAITPKKPHAE